MTKFVVYDTKGRKLDWMDVKEVVMNGVKIEPPPHTLAVITEDNQESDKVVPIRPV